MEESAAVLEAFKARLDQELVEALASLHQRIDRLCFQRADLWAQFCHLNRRCDLLAGSGECTDSESFLHTLD